MHQSTPIPVTRLSQVILLCFGLAWLLSLTPFVERLGLQSLDLRTRVRTHFQAAPDPRICLVLYTDICNTRTDIGLAPWPLDRKWHGQLMRLLHAAGSRVILWDVILDAAGSSEEGDQQMAAIAEALAEIGAPIISAAVASEDAEAAVPSPEQPTRPFTRIHGDRSLLQVAGPRAYLPYPALRQHSLFAFADTPQGADGIRRRIPLLIRIDGKVYPSLALQAVLSLLGVDRSQVDIVLGDSIRFSSGGKQWRIPIGPDGTYLLNFRYLHEGGPSQAFPTYPYVDLLLGLNAKYAEEKEDVSTPDLKDRIVVLGQTVTGMADAGPTQLHGYAPLPLVHANAIANILAEDYAGEAPFWLVWPAAGLLAFLLLYQCAHRSAKCLMLALFAVLVFHSLLCSAAWIAWSLWIPWVGPSLGFAASGFCIIGIRYRQEMQAKEKIRSMFGSYLSPELLEKISRQGTRLEVRSERRPVTILFSDLRNFTAWSEKVSETELILQLNEYLSAMVACIHAEGGTLHKFIGDAVMAVWGDIHSTSPEDDACRACRAALAMQKRLQELNSDWSSRGMQPLSMGIGLNQGIVLVGNIGSPQKMEFTVIGDPVNLASRLESLNKSLHTSILAGESVHRLAGASFAFLALGAVPVKGKEEDVQVFELKTAINN